MKNMQTQDDYQSRLERWEDDMETRVLYSWWLLIILTIGQFLIHVCLTNETLKPSEASTPEEQLKEALAKIDILVRERAGLLSDLEATKHLLGEMQYKEDKKEETALDKTENETKVEENGEAKKDTESATSNDVPTDIVQDSPGKESPNVAVMSEVQSPTQTSSVNEDSKEAVQSPTAVVAAKIETPCTETPKPSASIPECSSDSKTEPIIEEFEPASRPVTEEPKTAASPVTEEPKSAVSPVAEESKSVVTPVSEEPKPAACPVAEEPKPVSCPVAEEPKPVSNPVTEEPTISPVTDESKTVSSPVVEESKPLTEEPKSLEESKDIESSDLKPAESPVVEEQKESPQLEESKPVEEPKIESPVVVESKEIASPTVEETKVAESSVVEETKVAECPVEEKQNECPVEEKQNECPVEESKPIESPVEEPKTVQSPVAEEPKPTENKKNKPAESPLSEDSKLVTSPLVEEPKAVEISVVPEQAQVESEVQSPVSSNENIPAEAVPVISEEAQNEVPVQEKVDSPVEESAEKKQVGIETPANATNGISENGEENHQENGIDGQENGPAEIPTLIVWKNGGNQVAVSGDFNEWDDNCLLNEQDGVFSTKLKLTKGVHHLKFLVDGNWTVDESQPIIELDGHGKVNILTVQEN